MDTKATLRKLGQDYWAPAVIHEVRKFLTEARQTNPRDAYPIYLGIIAGLTEEMEKA